MKTLKKLGNGSVKNYVVLQSRCSCGSCGCGCSCATKDEKSSPESSSRGSQSGGYDITYSAHS